MFGHVLLLIIKFLLCFLFSHVFLAKYSNFHHNFSKAKWIFTKRCTIHSDDLSRFENYPGTGNEREISRTLILQRCDISPPIHDKICIKDRISPTGFPRYQGDTLLSAPETFQPLPSLFVYPMYTVIYISSILMFNIYFENITKK